ncbi:MAG: ATP-binding protein [Bacteroidetes bacterium]|jgi:predicted ATP-binding protein involved in virulence|nr:MAG: ATP-binding protein [Bacteroidota bacterium]
MRIKKLTVSGLRAFSHAEFTFLPGMNLLVGINGVGKTTVLDAIRICLSRILPEITSSRSPKQAFEINDISIGMDSLQVECDLDLQGKEFKYLFHKQKISSIPKKTGKPRDQVIETPDIEQINPSLKEFFPKSKESKTQPLGIYFSTRRSLLVDQKPSSSTIAGGQTVAFAESLSFNREVNLRLIAQWYKVQEKLAEEKSKMLKHISVLREAIELFLPAFSNLHIRELDRSVHFMIEKNGIPLSLFQLSDGERGVIAMVLDLARRLSQANPELDDPLRQGVAIVLIDELDLHCHPRWQRVIVENLIKTFPNCQFIATTHSPQIIGEVEPERITVIDNGTFKPISSYGVDSSRILEEVLDTLPRNRKVKSLLSKMYKSIDREELSTAKKQLANISKILGKDDAEIIRASTLIHFLEGNIKDEKNYKRKRTK